MNQTHINLLRQFYTRCANVSGCYCFEINGHAHVLESEACVEELINAVLLAPKDVQDFRLNQAEHWISLPL